VTGMDDSFDLELAAASLRAARPDATVALLEGVGHYPMVEAPALFLAAVLPGLAD